MPEAPLDLKKLLQDLGTHQTELQLQNEELRASQVALEQSKQEYAELFDSAPVGYFILSLKADIGKVNLAGARMLGGVPDDFVGRHFPSFLLREEIPKFHGFLKRVIADDIDSEIIVTISKQFLCLKARRTSDLQQCRVVAIDVTSQVAAEKATQEATILSSAALDAVMAHICVLDKDGNVLSVNQAWKDYGKEEALNDQFGINSVGYNYLDVCRQAKGLGAEGAAEVADGIQSVLAGTMKRFASEYPCHSPNRQRWFSLSVAPFQGDSGHVLVAHQDITERKLAEASAKVLETQFRLAQKLEAVGTLATGIAHDFNNILASISGFAELAREEAGDNVALAESLEGIRHSTQRAANLVKQILAVRPNRDSSFQTIELTPLVREVVGLLRAAIRTNVDFQLELPSNLYFVEADPDQMHQVIMNLGTNAAQAIGEKQGQVQVKLENRMMEVEDQEKLQPFVSLTISDNGSGMDIATKERAFDLFFTTKAPGEGTGIGLSVVHGIMQAHHGTVSLESVPGEGTRVEILLPAVLQAPLVVVEEQVPALPGAGERILFVDDEVSLGIIAKRALERVGYVVDLESRPEMALATLLSHPERYSLVMTDLTMPIMSGVEMARQIHSAQPQIPIILISGYAADLTSDLIEQAGICKILAKPVPLRVLESAVYQAIHGSV